MQKLLLVGLLFMSTFLFGCKSNSGGNPSAVLSDFFDAMQKNDKVKIKELCTAESATMLSMMDMGMNKGDKSMGEFDKTKVEFGEAIINGDNAKVPVKDKVKGEVINFPMKKENGQWKVAFDKSSMMEMASDKMNEKGINLGDSINKAMDGINMDSMKNVINKAMDGVNMDSMKKEVSKAMKGVNMDSIKNEVNKALQEAKQK
jgi:hypothetical protein